MRAAFGMAATVTGGYMGIYRRKHRDPGTGKVRLGHYYYKFTIDGVTYKQTVKTARTRRQAEEAERQARAATSTTGATRHGGAP